MVLLICIVPVCPLRAEASHRSEQVSQLLFGEQCEQIDKCNDFVKVKVVYDNYEGWCHENQLQESDSGDVTTRIAGEWVNEMTIGNKIMRVPFGSCLPGNDFNERNGIKYGGSFIDTENSFFDIDHLNRTCFTYLNTSYLWGGRSVFGIDCSGYTQMVYKCMNVRLLRDASQQVSQGDEVGFLQEVKPGDLAFFDNDAGRIIHVGILLSTNTIIHASGKVRVDSIDDLGIINSDNGKRTHKLRLIKRIGMVSHSTLF